MTSLFWVARASLLFGAIGAQSQGATSVRLSVTRTEAAWACPDATWLARALAERVGREAVVETSADEVLVAFDKAETFEAVVRLTVAGLRRSRTMKADTCARLADSVVLSLALAIDPTPVFHSSEPSKAPVLPRRPVSSLAPSERPLVAKEPTASTPWNVHFGAGGGLLIGQAPAVTASIHLAVALRSGVFDGEAGLQVAIPVRVALPVGSLETFHLAATMAPAVRFRFALLGGVLTAGVLRAQGLDLVEPHRLSLPWILAGARVGIELPEASLWAMRLFLDVQTPIIRVTLASAGAAAWVTPPLMIHLGMSLRFHPSEMRNAPNPQ